MKVGHYMAYIIEEFFSMTYQENSIMSLILIKESTRSKFLAKIIFRVLGSTLRMTLQVKSKSMNDKGTWEMVK